MPFLDDRIPRLLGRLFARNFPESLSATESLGWRENSLRRIQLPASEGSAELGDYNLLVERELADPDMPAPQRAIVHALLDWKSQLEARLLDK